MTSQINYGCKRRREVRLQIIFRTAGSCTCTDISKEDFHAKASLIEDGACVRYAYAHNTAGVLDRESNKEPRSRHANPSLTELPTSVNNDPVTAQPRSSQHPSMSVHRTAPSLFYYLNRIRSLVSIYSRLALGCPRRREGISLKRFPESAFFSIRKELLLSSS